MDANWNIRSITWNATSLDSGKASIAPPTGGPSTTLTLQNGLSNQSGGKVEVSTAIVLPTVQTWSDNGAFGDPNSSITITGGISGAGGIDKAGTGTLRLNSANSYAGGATLNAGRLGLGHDAALGSGSLTINGGALLFDQGDRILTNPIQFNPAQTTNVFLYGNSMAEFKGPINLGGREQRIFWQLAAPSATISGVISNGSLHLVSGLWHLTADNTFAGGLYVETAIVYAASDANLGSSGAQLKFWNGTLQPTASFTSSHPINIVGNNATLDTNGYDITLTGSISGDGYFSKKGAGTLTLSGNTMALQNSFYVEVVAGTLRLESATISKFTFTRIEPGAILTGVGTVGPIAPGDGGHIAPGLDSPGTLRVTYNMNLWSGAVFDFDLGPSASDQIVFEGDGYILNYGFGAHIINIFDAGGLAPGQTYTLFDWTNGSDPSGVQASSFQLGASPLPGNFVINGRTLQFVTAPEPSSAMLLVAGGGCAMLRRRRAAR